MQPAKHKRKLNIYVSTELRDALLKFEFKYNIKIDKLVELSLPRLMASYVEALKKYYGQFRVAPQPQSEPVPGAMEHNTMNKLRKAPTKIRTKPGVKGRAAVEKDLFE